MATNPDLQAFRGSEPDRTPLGRQEASADHQDEAVNLVAQLQRDFQLVSGNQPLPNYQACFSLRCTLAVFHLKTSSL